MSNTVGEIYDVIDGFAPFDSQADFDNAGLCVGNREAVVSKTLVCLDITKETIDEAVRLGAQLIVSHHPVIFNPIKQLSADSVVYRMAQAGLSAVCAHTNWDQADGGVNDVLFELVSDGAKCEAVTDEEGLKLIRIGKMNKEYSLLAYAEYCKKKLSSPWLQVVDYGLPVRTVAVVGGSYGDGIETCRRAGADTVVTGEAKYHEMLSAEHIGVNLICAGHYETEAPSMATLRDRLADALPGTEFILSDVKPRFKGV